MAYYDHPPEFTASSELQNKYVYFPVGTNQYSGGATLGAYGAAGWVQSSDVAYADRAELPSDFVVYRNADSTKSWFMLDDEVVVLAAGIGDQAGRAVTTSLDARLAAVGDAVSLTGVQRNGRKWSGTGNADLKWLRYANATAGSSLGYYFLQSSPVAVGLEQVTRSRRVIRTANPDTAVTKNVFTLTHQTTKRAALAYALVPHATEARLDSYRYGRLLVLANTSRLQAIHHQGLNLTAANTFTPGHHQVVGLTIDGPASVITQRHANRTTTIAVSDPTTTRATITLNVLARWLTKVTADPGVQVTHTLTGTRLTYPTHQTHGRTLTATFRG